MKKLNSLYFLLLVFVPFQIFGGAFIKDIIQKGATDDKIFMTDVDKKKNQRTLLQEKLPELKEAAKKFSTEAKTRLAEIATQIGIVKTQIGKEPQNEDYLNSKLSTLNDRYQAFKELQQLYKQQVELVEEHIEVLEEYLKDPNLEQYAQEYRGGKRPIYSFTDLQTLNKMILEQKERVEHLKNQEKNTDDELSSRGKSFSAAQQAYKKKREDLKEFAQSPETKIIKDMFGFDTKQKMTLLELQEKLVFQKQELASLELSVTKYKVSQIKTKVFVAVKQLNILEVVKPSVKSLTIVRSEEISAARAQLQKKKQQSFINNEKNRRNMEALSRENERRMRELKKLSTRYNIALDSKLDQWGVEPKQTVTDYVSLCVIGHLNSYYLFVERRKEFIESHMSLEDKKLVFENLQIDVKNSFYGITSKKFTSEEMINKEIAEYDAPKSDSNATIARFKEKENAVVSLLNTQKNARDNVSKLIEDLQGKRSTIFRNSPKEYNQCLFLVDDARKKIQQQVDLIEKMIGVYHDIVATSEDSKEQISFIVNELGQMKGIWRRAKYAIKLEELKNFVPDVNRFIGDMWFSITQFRLSVLLEKMKSSFPRRLHVFLLFLKIFALLAFLFFLRWYVAIKLYRVFAHVTEYRGLRVMSFLVRAFFDFIFHYYVTISIWILLFALLQFGAFPDDNLHILFYLFSIPYFLYLANRFLYRFVSFNERQDYFILTKQFQPRFFFIVSTLLYTTICIQFFKGAFILKGYKSELPEILLALNFIILQISLIFLITKDQILSVIPNRTTMWKAVHVQVDRFFYLILACIIAIIVMSNPYVGFGSLVLHILSRLFFTILFFLLLFWFHAVLKRSFSKLFFSRDDEGVKERFSSAKTWYGIVVILVFLVLAVIGFAVGAHLWGWQVTFDKIKQLFFYRGAEGGLVSIADIFKLFGFVIAGFLSAFAFNKFVLKKIFDLLLVEMGIQHAVVSITRYLIIIALTMIGMQYANLTQLIKWLLVSLVGIAWIVKDPLGDFIAYFMILIQRPLKIGDYIKIDEQTSGVVRKITPRSVIIRQKNSTTIVVPNAQVLSQAIFNWNYVSGFIAIDDILVNISYKEDPDRVLKIIRSAVELHSNILKSPQATVRLNQFGEYSFIFLIRAYVSSHYTLDKWDIASALRLLIVRELRSNGIDITVPARIMISSNSKTKVVKPRVDEKKQPE